MIKFSTPRGTVLPALLLIIISCRSFGQSVPADEILQWELEIARLDSLNLVEQSDMNTLLVKQLRQRNQGTPIFWVEITPTPKRWHVSQQIRQANSLIEQYCKRHDDLHFIRTFDYYATAGGLPDSTFFQPDMLHLNRKGYLQWSEIIKASLWDAGIRP